MSSVIGVAQLAGVGPIIQLGGREWTVRGRDIEYYALMEAEIVRTRGNPFDMIVDAAMRADGKIEVVDMIANSVSERFRNWQLARYNDYSQFIFTPYGEAFQIWAAIRHNDSSLTIRQVQFWVMEMLQKEGAEGLKKKDAIIESIDQASGEGQLGN